MKPQIAERKNTTEKGLKELEILIDSLDFNSDIVKINSCFFEGQFINDDGDLTQIISFELKDGDIYIIDEFGVKKNLAWCHRINFQAAIEALESVVEKYNELCEKKDTQISEFLNFCEKFKTK